MYIRLILFILFISFSCRPASDPKQQPPNIVVILADDLGWADLGCYGNTYHETPHIDAIAKEGVLFTNAYAAASVCSPTRASLLTGKNPARLSLTNFIPGFQNRHGYDSSKPFIESNSRQFLPLEEVTLAEIFSQYGFVTASIGKWHLGDTAYYPTQQGFDINLGGCHMGYPANYFYPYVREGRFGFSLPNLEDGEEGEYLTDRLTKEAVKYIRENKDRPFFLYLSHYAVHTRMQAKEAIIEKYRMKASTLPDTVFANPVYAAMLHSLDEGVGEVINILRELELLENTLVIFASDNGGLVHESGPHTPPTTNKPLRLGKAFLAEGGIRVPLIIRWPGAAMNGQVSQVVTSTYDLFPTLLDYAGISNPDESIDGVTLADHLASGGPLPRKAIYWHFPHYHPVGADPASAVRFGDYKYIYYYQHNREELFNLKHDMSETTNLANQYSPELLEGRSLLMNWKVEVEANDPRVNPTFDPGNE